MLDFTRRKSKGEEREDKRRNNILCDSRVGSGKDGGQLLNEMWTIPGLLQLIYYIDDDVIVDSLGIYL